MSTPFNVTPDTLRAEATALRGLTRALLAHEQDAEDIEQETWLAALRHPPAGTAGRSAWLARVARNFARRKRRKEEARQRREREAARPESTPSTLEAVERLALHQQIVEAVMALDEPYRATVVLRFWEDRPPRDLARLMGVPVATVRTRVRRALIMLRERLDRSFGDRAAWSGLLALGAEHAAVVGTTTVPAASVVFAGVLLMTTKVKLATAALGAVALSWLSWTVWSGPADIRPRSDAAVHAPAVTGTAAGTEEPPALATRRAPVDLQPIVGSVDGNDQTPVLVDPYEVRVHVVDGAGDSVSGARIEAWDAERKSPHRSGHYSRERSSPVPFLLRLTDQTGHCTLQLDREMLYLHAAKEGVGESDDSPVWHRSQREGELILALSPAVRLRGLVLRADESPAVNVDVRVRHAVASNEVVRTPQPAKTDWQGRFAVDLRPATQYEIIAQADEERAEAHVSTLTAGDKEVVIRFAGAFSIRGFLVAPNGSPQGGRVQLWETGDPQQHEATVRLLVTSAATEADGSFRIEVVRPGQYRVLGIAAGHANSALTSVEVTAGRPHADILVRLLPTTSIAGVVRHENGERIAGAMMFAAAEQGEDPMWVDRPTRDDLFARVEPVTTGADGTFRLSGLHPQATYTLACVPNPDSIGIRIREKGVVPGRQDLLLVLTDAAIRGSSITGAVVADDTGDPITDFRIEFVHYRDDGTVRGTSAAGTAVIESGRYTLPALSLGTAYSFVVLPRDHAAKFVGPISTSARWHTIDVRLERLGEIECRVVDEQGRAVVNIKVAVLPVVRIPGTGDRGAGATQADGTLRATRLPPGEYEVCALRDGRSLEGTGKRVEVRPAKTTSVELRIPR